jgi:nucleoid-associated protein YgaU
MALLMYDTIRSDMRNRTIFVLAFLFSVLSATAVFAMGGPAPEAPKGETSTTQTQTSESRTVAVSGEVATERTDIEKANSELTSLEAQREKIDNYMEVLNKKIINAKTSGDSKKALELQVKERAMSNQEKKIGQRILAIKQKYPDLKPGENTAAPAAETAVTPAEKPAETPKAVTPNVVYHEVMMGDTLMSISRKYFDTPAYYKDIAKMNNITDMGYLPQGTKLMIDLNLKGGKPAVAVAPKKAATKPSVSPAVQPSTGGIVYHVVMPKETLMSISRKYFNGSASYYKEIMEMNGLTDPSLKIGMKLKIDTSLKKESKPIL